jgi:glycosyltransferase involved in cell wall biosynthesis
MPIPSSNHKTSLVILTWNEIEAVRALADRIPYAAVDETLVIDGGSTDGTIEFFRQRGIPVFVQEKRGHGEAYKEGLRKASGDIVVFFSGDGNEEPSDIPRMVEKMREGYDLVIATRFSRRSRSFDATPVRRFGNLFFVGLVNLRFGSRLTDVFNAFRALRREAMLRMDLQESFFQSELEMVMKSLRMGMRAAEVPTDEMERIGGEAKLRTVRDGWANLKCYFKYFLWSPGGRASAARGATAGLC